LLFQKVLRKNEPQAYTDGHRLKKNISLSAYTGRLGYYTGQGDGFKKRKLFIFYYFIYSNPRNPEAKILLASTLARGLKIGALVRWTWGPPSIVHHPPHHQQYPRQKKKFCKAS